MSNDITELRSILFDTLRSMKAGDAKDIARAKAVSDVSQTIINTARLEIDHAKVTGRKTCSGFLTTTAEQAKSMADLQPSVVHRMK